MKSAVASLLGSAALAAAHGFVQNATIGGEEYEFYQPYQDPYKNPMPDRVSRPIEGNGPVMDVTSIDIQCGGNGKGSSPAKLEAKVAAGSEVTLNWTLWPTSYIGPVITYMAKCPDAGCTDYQPGTDAVWFKVQEGGREGTSNTWAATPLMTPGNSGAKYLIPECLAPGHYLVRHEIIALHASSSYPGAQFYPGCHQLEVTGSGNTSPSNLVAFPGAYSKDDAGIVYDAGKAQEYTIPGPALFSCSGSGSGSGSAPAPTTSSPATPPIANEDDEDCPVESSSAPVTTPTQPAGSDENDCPAESSAAPSAVITKAAAQPTAAADDYDDDCPVESSAAPTATPTQAASDSSDGGDDCPAETAAPLPARSEPVNDYDEDCPAESSAPTPTPAADEDDCPAESSAPTPTQPADDYEDDCPAESSPPTPTQAAGEDEDDCPVESSAPTPTQPADDYGEDCPVESSAPTPSHAAGEDEDDCPVESSAPAPTQAASEDEDDCPAESSSPIPTQPADDYDEDDCPAETPSASAVAKRMSFQERRSVMN